MIACPGSLDTRAVVSARNAKMGAETVIQDEITLANSGCNGKTILRAESVSLKTAGVFQNVLSFRAVATISCLATTTAKL